MDPDEQAWSNADEAQANQGDPRKSALSMSIYMSIAGYMKRKKFLAIAIIIIVALGYGVYDKYFHLTDEEIAKKELAAAIVDISDLIILPQGDEPVLATVTDAEALIKQQAFFSGSVNGDQLLLFPKNMKAVIYSPTRNIIVNAGPIEQQAQNQEAQIQNTNAGNPQSSAPLSVEVRNGTSKTGYAATVADQIGANAGYSVIKASDASRKDYARIMVFNKAKDESKKSRVDDIVKVFGAEVLQALPENEADTEADVLIILGGK